MCDYSLHTFPNRLASEGEDLILHRFGGASIGLASPADLRPPALPGRPQTLASKLQLWLRNWFGAQEPEEDVTRRVPAVCVPPGARLVLRDIPTFLQRQLGVQEEEEVEFVQTSARVNTYRDAVRFKNNRQILLQALSEGQRATVMSLTPAEDEQVMSFDAVVQRW